MRGKRFLIIEATLILLTFTAIAGLYIFWRYFLPGPLTDREEATTRTPDEVIIAIAQKELTDIEQSIQAAEAGYDNMLQSLEQQKQKLKTGESKLTEVRERLKRAETLLSEPSDSYNIAGRTYSHQDLIDDVRDDLSRHKIIHNKLVKLEKSVAEDQQRAKEWQSILYDAKVLLAQKKDEFDSLVDRLRRARVAREAQRIQSQLLGTLATSSEMSGIDRLKERVRNEEIELKVDFDDFPMTGKIDWEGDTSSTEDMLEEIRSLPK